MVLDDVKNVLQYYQQHVTLRHGGQQYFKQMAWSCQYGYLRLSYTRFFDGGLQQESFADNEDNNNNSNNGNNNSNENLSPTREGTMSI